MTFHSNSRWDISCHSHNVAADHHRTTDFGYDAQMKMPAMVAANRGNRVSQIKVHATRVVETQEYVPFLLLGDR